MDPNENKANAVNDPAREKHAQKPNTTNKEVKENRETTRKGLPSRQCPNNDNGFLSGNKALFSGLKASLEPSSNPLLGDSNKAYERMSLQLQSLWNGTGPISSDALTRPKFGRVSTSGGTTTWSASYTAENPRVAESIAMEKAMYQTLRRHDTIHTTIRVERNTANRDRSRLYRAHPWAAKKVGRRNPNAGPNKTLEWAPLQGECANCGRSDHTVLHCWGPTDKYGLISTCPCNGKGHLSSSCPVIKRWSSFVKYKVFFLCRIGLPQFKHGTSFVHMICHDYAVRSLHSMVMHLVKAACPSDPSLSCRYNPLTLEFCMSVWNHAKLWELHNYQKPQERFCNLPDPAYMGQNWLQQAKQAALLNPLEQSFLDSVTTRDLRHMPGMSPTWHKLTAYQRLTDAERFVKFQQGMQQWRNFYHSMHDKDRVLIEFLLSGLTETSKEVLGDACMRDFNKVYAVLQEEFAEAKSPPLPAKPGIGLPRVPQNMSEMELGSFFVSLEPDTTQTQPPKPPVAPSGDNDTNNVNMTEIEVEKTQEELRIHQMMEYDPNAKLFNVF